MGKVIGSYGPNANALHNKRKEAVDLAAMRELYKDERVGVQEARGMIPDDIDDHGLTAGVTKQIQAKRGGSIDAAKRINDKIASQELLLDAYNGFRGLMTSLGEVKASIQGSNTSSVTATPANTGAASLVATSGSSQVNGTYNIQVTARAEKHVVYATLPNQAGSVTINGQNFHLDPIFTAAEVAQMINDSDCGVNVTVHESGLKIEALNSGVDNIFDISANMSPCIDTNVRAVTIPLDQFMRDSIKTVNGAAIDFSGNNASVIAQINSSFPSRDISAYVATLGGNEVLIIQNNTDSGQIALHGNSAVEITNNFRPSSARNSIVTIDDGNGNAQTLVSDSNSCMTQDGGVNFTIERRNVGQTYTVNSTTQSNKQVDSEAVSVFFKQLRELKETLVKLDDNRGTRYIEREVDSILSGIIGASGIMSRTGNYDRRALVELVKASDVTAAIANGLDLGANIDMNTIETKVGDALTKIDRELDSLKKEIDRSDRDVQKIIDSFMRALESIVRAQEDMKIYRNMMNMMLYGGDGDNGKY